MKKHLTAKTQKFSSILSRAKFFALTLFLGSTCGLFAQSNNDNEMINQFIEAKGYTQTIIFSPENIKQFWIDKSVSSQNGEIKILLNNRNNSFESVPLKVQLANVDEGIDCKVDVISTNINLSFAINNSKNENISSSIPENDFINYHIASSTFHMENAQDYSFSMLLSSTRDDILSIKKIILSFMDNKNSSFLRSPGKLVLSKDTLTNQDAIVSNTDGSFSRAGVYINFLSSKYIFVKNNTLAYSAKVKNTGNAPSRIYAGYKLFAKGGIALDGKNFPYKNLNKTAKIVSAKKGSTSIVIDTFLEGTKDCFLSLDAKDDLSDIPSFSFANGKIVSIKQLDDGQAEITMSETLKDDIKEGTTCRINARSGSHFYLQTKILQPGETGELSFEVKLDQNHHFYTGSKIPSGVYYVQPLLYSHSQDTKVENTVQISDFEISY